MKKLENSMNTFTVFILPENSLRSLTGGQGWHTCTEGYSFDQVDSKGCTSFYNYKDGQPTTKVLEECDTKGCSIVSDGSYELS